jgi:lipopolysaccharide biosynthesis glycosyltransferase
VSERVVVATAADGAYALPLAVMLRSLVEHAAPERRLEVFVLDDGLGPELRRRVEQPIRDRLALHWIEAPLEPRRGLPLWGRMPAATYCKLLIPRCLPGRETRILWLDADLVVLTDLGELWRQGMGESTILAAPDPFVPSISSRLGVAAWAELGLHPEAPYFNAGVMLIDLTRWRRDEVSERAAEYLRRFRDRVFFHDQEALNVVLTSRWAALDDRFNHCVSAPRAARETGAPPAILHYSGSLKPWRQRSGGRHHATYYAHLDLTDWRGFRPPRSLRADALGLYQCSALRRLLTPLEQAWFRASVGRTRRLVGDERA